MDQSSKIKRARASIKSRLKGNASTPRAKIEIPRPVDRLECDYGDILELGVRVSNEGSEVLDSSHPFHPDFLSYHWLSPEGESLVEDGFRTPLLSIVHPGQSQVVRLKVSVSAMVGEAVLEIDMVKEGIYWFAEVGGKPLRIPCSIGSLEAPAKGERGSAAGIEVSEFWGRRAEVRAEGEYLGWLDHPVVLQECMLAKLGTGETNWLQAMMRLHDVPRGGHWLSLGCGEGGLELWLLEQGEAGSIEGVDVSGRAIEIACESARERGLESASFRVIDLDGESLPDETCDVIIASMAIHHIDRLEDAFSKIYRALKPGGYFFANEYVGPDRFNFPPRQVELANSVIAVLPRELRRDVMASMERGTTIYKDRYVWRSPEHWLEIDSSEAARSSEIIPVFTSTFPSNWIYNFGGPLLHLVLEHIAANFDPENERDRAVIRLLDVLECTSIKAGYLDNDFAVLAGRKE